MSNDYFYTVSAGNRKQPNGRQRERGDTDEEVSRIPTCWDSDVVLLLGSASTGDVGTLPLESVMSSDRLSLPVFSHLVTRNLRGDNTKRDDKHATERFRVFLQPSTQMRNSHAAESTH